MQYRSLLIEEVEFRKLQGGREGNLTNREREREGEREGERERGEREGERERERHRKRQTSHKEPMTRRQSTKRHF